MLVTPSPMTMDVISEQALAHGALFHSQSAIAPVPLMVSVPPAVMTQSTFSPHAPLPYRSSLKWTAAFSGARS